MIYKENYLKYYFVNERSNDFHLKLMSNYEYAQSLTPKLKGLKRPKRPCIQENGLYRLNVYARHIPKLPKMLSRSPVQLRDTPEQYRTHSRTDNHYNILPNSRFSNIIRSELRTVKRKDRSESYNLTEVEKAFKDVGLGTDD